jgi:hypothetical protein
MLPELERVLRSMKEALRTAVAAATAQRASMATAFAPEGLTDRAADRQIFNATALALQSALNERVAQACTTARLPRVSITMLAHALDADDLLALYRATRALASRLETEDEVNRQMLKRSLQCVNAYLGQLAPKPIYDRRGYARQTQMASTLSTRI